MARTFYYYKSAPWKAGVFFLLLSTAWSYVVYCLCYYQSFFSWQSLIAYGSDQLLLFLIAISALFLLWRLFYWGLWLVLLHVMVVFFETSHQLWNSTAPLTLFLNIAFLVMVSLNLYQLVRQLDRSALRRRYHKKGYFGAILLKIPARLTLSIPDGGQLILEGKLIDWDEETMRLEWDQQQVRVEEFLALFRSMDKKLFFKQVGVKAKIELEFSNHHFEHGGNLLLVDEAHQELGIELLTAPEEGQAPARLNFADFKQLTEALGFLPNRLY